MAKRKKKSQIERLVELAELRTQAGRLAEQLEAAQKAGDSETENRLLNEIRPLNERIVRLA